MLITNNIDSNVTEINACNPLTLHPNNDNFLKITGPSKKLTIDKKMFLSAGGATNLVPKEYFC